MLNNDTAQWLLSTIVQSMAAIWALFFGLFIVLREMILDRRQQINDPRGNIHLSDNVKIFLCSINIWIFSSILFGILGLYFFRDEGLIVLTVLFAVFSIMVLVVYFTHYIIKKI
jgi:hypothetical protein